MNEDMRHNHGPWGSRMKLVLIGFALIGGYFLIGEHRAHVLPYLPWLLLAACPLMHMFMHGGHNHGGHGGHGGDTASSDPPAAKRGTGEPNAAPPPSDHSHHRGDRPS